MEIQKEIDFALDRIGEDKIHIWIFNSAKKDGTHHTFDFYPLV